MKFVPRITDLPCGNHPLLDPFGVERATNHLGIVRQFGSMESNSHTWYYGAVSEDAGDIKTFDFGS